MPTCLPRVARLVLCALLLGLLGTVEALASDPASQQIRDQQRALQQIEQHQRLQQWQRRGRVDSSIESTTSAPADHRCWAISGVRITGNKQISSADLEQHLRPLLPSCTGVADLNRLLKAITELYVRAGYPASRPYLARQPATGKPLEVVIIEGFVESIRLADPDLPLSLRGAFPNLLGRPLYLPDLEQGLDQLNRLRAYDLTAALLPGTLQGGTQILIEPRAVGSRWHLDSRLDNRGSPLTGRHRLSLGLGVDSPLQVNDDLRLTLNAAVFDAPGQSQGASLYYSVPYGPWTFAVNASQLSYRAPIPGASYTSNGTSSFQGVSAERVLWRGQHGMLSASARLDRKQLQNRLDDSLLQLQSPTLTTLESGVNLLWLDAGLWHGYLGIARGLAWLGADPPASAAAHPQAQFLKYRANLLHLRQGPAQSPWRWQSELNLQYSRDVLPAIEQLLLSDDSAVRGFRAYSVAGASGAVWRNSVSQPLAVPLPFNLQLRPQLSLDLGWARLASDSPWQRLAGAAAGVEVSLPGSRLRLDYQYPLYASDRYRQALEPGFWVLDWSLSL